MYKFVMDFCNFNIITNLQFCGYFQYLKSNIRLICLLNSLFGMHNALVEEIFMVQLKTIVKRSRATKGEQLFLKINYSLPNMIL